MKATIASKKDLVRGWPKAIAAVAGEADVLCTVDNHFYDPNVLAFCSRHGIQLMTDVELLHHLRSLYPRS